MKYITNLVSTKKHQQARMHLSDGIEASTTLKKGLK